MYKLRKSLAAVSLLFITAGFMSGCKKQLDINQNPNYPTLEQGTPALVLPAAVLQTTGKVGGDLAIVGGIWAEYYTQSALANQYKDVDSYNMPNTDNFVNDVWDGLYAGGLKNYQYVISEATTAGDWNTNLMAVVMKAYTTAILVDLFDKIPYSQALKGSANLNPTFDDGYSIYTSLLSSIDSALGHDFTVSTNTNIGTQDLVFGGDMSQWFLFANTLKLKLYLRMVNAHPDVAQAGIAAMTAAGAQYLTNDAAVTNFSDAPGQDNPFYEWNIRTLNTTSNLRASGTFVLWLQENNDPRIASYFGPPQPSSVPGAPYPYVNQGDYTGGNVNYQKAAIFVQTPTDPVEFISGAESDFLQAEAVVRGWMPGDAQSLYNLGVTAAFSDVGQDATSFIAPGGAYAWGAEKENGVVLTSIQQIIRQKWASFPYGSHAIEGFFDKNRTGFPPLSPVYSTDPGYIPGQIVEGFNSVLSPGLLPQRFVFAYDETSRNSNAPQQVVPISTPVWWAIQ